MLAEFSSLSFPEGSNKRRRKGFDLRLEHGVDFGENERLAQGVLCANRPAQPRQAAHDPCRLAIEHRFAAWPCRPIDGVFQHARHPVIIFRRGDQNRTGAADEGFEVSYRLRNAFLKNIIAVRRNLAEPGLNRDFHSRRRQLHRRAQ